MNASGGFLISYANKGANMDMPLRPTTSFHSGHSVYDHIKKNSSGSIYVL